MATAVAAFGFHGDFDLLFPDDWFFWGSAISLCLLGILSVSWGMFLYQLGSFYAV